MTDSSHAAVPDALALSFATDGRAFEAVVRRHQPMVFRLCSRYAASDAADLAQETFLRAWAARDRYDPARPLAPWLCAVARRLCIDRLRQRRPEVAADEAPVQVDSAPPADRVLGVRQELAIVARAMTRLPEGQREALSLFELEGLSYAEIASALDVPVGTVMTWIFRARQRLRQSLAEASGVAPGKTP